MEEIFSSITAYAPPISTLLSTASEGNGALHFSTPNCSFLKIRNPENSTFSGIYKLLVAGLEDPRNPQPQERSVFPNSSFVVYYTVYYNYVNHMQQKKPLFSACKQYLFYKYYYTKYRNNITSYQNSYQMFFIPNHRKLWNYF